MSFKSNLEAWSENSDALIPVSEVAAVQSLAMGIVRERHNIRHAMREPYLFDAAARALMNSMSTMPKRLVALGSESDVSDFAPGQTGDNSITLDATAKRSLPPGKHQFVVYDGGSDDPATEPGHETYIGISVKKDLERRDNWSMLLTVRHIPLQEEAIPEPDITSMTTWERYRFGWRRKEPLCEQADLRIVEKEYVFDESNRVEVVGHQVTKRPVTLNDCEVLRHKLLGVAEAIDITPDDELRMIGKDCRSMLFAVSAKQ